MNTEHTTMTTVYIVKWTQDIQLWRRYILLNEHRTYNNDDCIYC